MSLPSTPTRETYLAELARESRLFRDALTACDPVAPVPSCPDWDADDLLWHLTGVQSAWAWAVEHRPASPASGMPEPTRPADHDGLLAAFDAASAALQHQLASTEPTQEAWTWSADHSVGFILRRQAHEVLIHRLDAELTADAPRSPMDPGLAADGVHECLAVMYAGVPPWGHLDPLSGHVEFRLTDTGDSLWIRPALFSGTDPDEPDQEHHDEPDIEVVTDPGVAADVVVAGSAADLDAWLWKRGTDGVEITGEGAVRDHLERVLGQSID